MLAGLKNTYQAVAKRHVHPWYTWAILAVAIGFTVGVAYVANQNAQFDSSQAAILSGRSNSSTLGNSTAVFDKAGKALFEIVSPADRTEMQTNPRIVIAFNAGVIRRNSEAQFTYAMADKSGKPVGPFAKLAVTREANPAEIGRLTYIINNFESFQPGSYYIRVSMQGAPTKSFANIILIKQPDSKTSTLRPYGQVERRGVFSGDMINCFTVVDEEFTALASDYVNGNPGEPKEFYKRDGHYDQGHTSGCALVSLINMNLDTFGIDMKDIVIKCAVEAGVEFSGMNPVNGVNYAQIEQMFSCKLSKLPAGKHADGLMITGPDFNLFKDPDEDGPEKSPCKEIEKALADGGSAAIGITTSGGNGHMAQVIAMDCSTGKIVIRDPNGHIVTARVVSSTIVGAQSVPSSDAANNAYNGSSVDGVVIEHKR
jgi:hypothetical protein